MKTLYAEAESGETIVPWEPGYAQNGLPMPVAAVFFDVGETLADETEIWGGWADRMEVPRLTFFAALGAVLARRGDPVEAVPLTRPDLHPAAAQCMLRVAERDFTEEDLYPDVVPCLLELAQRGIRIGIGSNQPWRSEKMLRRMRLPIEWLPATDVPKPDPVFFQRIVALTGLDPASIAFVGDRVDNDLVPAARAGLLAIHLRRGPWGVLQASWPEVECATLRLGSLRELPLRLAEL